MSRTRVLAAMTAAALLASAGVAGAATKSTTKVKFSTKATKASTSLAVTATYAQANDGSYGILTDTQLKLPTGTKFNTAAVPACTATDQQIADDPGGANKLCPANSKLGTGSADVIIAGPPVHFEGPIFNRGGNRIILELMFNGAPAYDIDGVIKGSTVDFPLTMAEQLGTHPTKVTLKIGRHGTAKKPFLRTPTTCPKSGKWKGSSFNQFGGAAASADKPLFTIPCTKPPAK